MSNGKQEFKGHEGRERTMKILFQNISTRAIPGVPDAEKMWNGIGNHILSLTMPDTIVDFAYLSRASYFVASKYMEMLNSVYILNSLISKVGMGYDAAVIGCFNDPGLWEARESLDIPIIGIGESAMHAACMLGRNFGVVTVRKKLIPVVEDNVRRYGLESRLIRQNPIRSCELDEKLYPAMFSDPVNIAVPPFEAEAKKLVADGAEVVVVGCASLGPALSLAGYRLVSGTRVPVIDATAIAVKMAEALGQLGKTLGLSTSKALKYQSLPKPIVDGIRSSLGFKTEP
jgi:allantoin racemase